MFQDNKKDNSLPNPIDSVNPTSNFEEQNKNVSTPTPTSIPTPTPTPTPKKVSYSDLDPNYKYNQQKMSNEQLNNPYVNSSTSQNNQPNGVIDGGGAPQPYSNNVNQQQTYPQNHRHRRRGGPGGAHQYQQQPQGMNQYQQQPQPQGMNQRMAMSICQSCGLPLTRRGNRKANGTEKDGSICVKFCNVCYNNGSFVDPSFTSNQVWSKARKEMLKAKDFGLIAKLWLLIFYRRINLKSLERWRNPVYRQQSPIQSQNSSPTKPSIPNQPPQNSTSSTSKPQNPSSSNDDTTKQSK